MLGKLTLKKNGPIALVMVIGGLVYLAIEKWAPPELREELVGANGFLWTAIAYLLRSPFAHATDEKSDSGSGSINALVPIGLALGLTASTLSGCGASALERHADAASILHSSATVAGVAIREATEQLATHAAAPCLPEAVNRQPVEVCDAAIERALEHARPWVIAYNALAAAVDLYAAAVLRMASGDGFDRDDVIALGFRALAELGELLDLLEAAGVRVPDLPSVAGIAALVNGGGSS